MTRFWFHYNKPESRRRNRPVMSLHFSKKCHIVSGLTCKAPVFSRHRKTAPRMVMFGDAVSITVDSKGMAYIL